MEFKTTSKLTLACVLFSFPCANAMANYVMMPTPSYFNGYKVGAGIGGSILTTDMSNTTIVNSYNNYFTGQAYKFGPMANLFAGYGSVYNNQYYLGAELGLNIYDSTGTSITNNNQDNVHMAVTDTQSQNSPSGFAGTVTVSNFLSSSTTVTRNNLEPALDLKGGMLLTSNSMLYALGGICFNQFQVRTKSSYVQNASLTTDAIDPPTNPSAGSVSGTVVSTQTKNMFGVRLGGGVEVLFTPNLSVAADYVYTFFPNLGTNGSVPINQLTCDALEGCTSNANGNFTSAGSSNVSEQTILLKLIYHFG